MLLIEVAIQTVRDILGHAVARRHPPNARAALVRVRRVPGNQQWIFTIPLGGLKPSSRVDFAVVGSNALELAGHRVDFSSATPPLAILRTEVKAGKLLVLVAAADSALGEPPREDGSGSRELAEAARRIQGLSDPVRQVAAARAIRGLESILEQAPAETVREAAAASSDVAVILRALEAPDALEPLRIDDPLSAARMRGVHERERLMNVEGGTWPVDDVARHLNLTRQAVNRRRQHGTLLALDAGRHGYRYPAWQFVREGVVSGLETALSALSRFDPWTQQSFMLGQNARLSGRTPVEALREGAVDRVVRAADAHGEHGAA